MKAGNVKWVRLGDYIEQCDERNEKGIYDVGDVRGISIEKRIIATKANMDGVSVTNYKIYRTNYFCYVPVTSRNGGKITIALNVYDATYIVSSAYEVFKIKNETKLLPLYLFLFFLRPEFDRYARYNSWGSAREVFSWEDMCNTLIPLPSIAEQRKIVNVWKAFREIKEQNEAKAAPLMQVCQSYIQELKHQYPMQEIGPYIQECNERNLERKFTEINVRGLATSKGLIETKANLDDVSLNTYKLLRPNEIAFVSDTSRRGDKMSLGLNNSNKTYILSSISTVFKVDRDNILPDYLYLWFCRSEFDRYARFNSWGSAREAFSFEDMKRCKIPLPPIEVQQAVVNIYKCANEATQIAEEADRLSREACPALLQYIIIHTPKHN